MATMWTTQHSLFLTLVPFKAASVVSSLDPTLSFMSTIGSISSTWSLTAFTDRQRCIALGRHVDGEAMRWLIRDIVPNLQNFTWEQVSQRMIDRFRRATHSFLNDALDRELKPNETLESFFNDKRRLMSLAKLDEHNQVAMLTRGIPNHLMRTQIAAAMPQDSDSWLRVALVIEANLKRRSYRDERKPFVQSRQTDVQSHHLQDNAPSEAPTTDANQFQRNADNRRNAPRLDFSRPPTAPCPVCRCLLNTREFHWKKDCQNLRLFNASRNTSETTSQDNSQTLASTSSSTDNSTFHLSPPEFVWFDLTVNGRHVRAMLDTGSSVTAISRTAATRLQLKWNQSRSLFIRHVDGFTHTLGTISATVTLEGQTLRTTLHVFDKLGPEMLIGVDLARTAGLLSCFTDRPTRSHALQLNAGTDSLNSSSHHLAHSLPLPLSSSNRSSPTNSDLIKSSPDVFAQERSNFGRMLRSQDEIALLTSAHQPLITLPFQSTLIEQHQTEHQPQWSSKALLVHWSDSIRVSRPESSCAAAIADHQSSSHRFRSNQSIQSFVATYGTTLTAGDCGH